ncbi:Chitotriosidase-1 [Atta colombica]|uniref:chitinase n=1 Tax=Atta colombica TaxID=520822 RepID=A0A195BL01_9HYME|nr:Chitotriosidase-1 [Atta colombica]
MRNRESNDGNDVQQWDVGSESHDENFRSGYETSRKSAMTSPSLRFAGRWTTDVRACEVRAASLILCLGILLATIHDGIAERRIVCYYTNWSVYRPGTAKFSPQNINPYLCTHLIYAFGGFTKENALKPFDKYQDIEKGGYAKFTGLKTYNKNLKTMLAIGGWNEGSSRFSPMVADSARRREFVKNAIKFLRQNHFDGLDLDWEYPAFRDGGKPRDKDNYADLVQELREEFERESSKTGRSRLLLSMAMPAGAEYIDKGYDVPRLNEYLDFINLLSYDYHSAYEPAVNHHSPLYPLEEDNEYNYDAELTIDYTITHLLEKGASADKVVLGIPTYGRSYTLFNQDATELGSPADGPGTEGEATREKGYLAYYEICESIADSDEWEVVQPNPKAMGPYAFKDNQWVGYDDEDIVKLKAHYVNEKKLGGIMFWSIDNDDFRGKCHGRPYPLIEAAKEALLTDNRNTIDKTKSVDNRKKTRTQNTQSSTRKSSISNRRSSTTSAPIISKRVSSSRPKYRTISQASKEEQEDREVSRRSYDPLSDEDTEGRNTVRVTEKTERPKNQNRSKTQSADRTTRRKHSRRKGQNKIGENEESLSNKLTTPEPPTTPDPGTDFKCEDEGFFPHPRDCKKYFWCLDSGPGGLGVVAHQFICPSGLVFNKGADSCDYPRNVICPKTSKTSIVSTTRSPITAATSRTTYLHSTTTAKEESEEYDSEEDDNLEEDDEEDEEEEEEEKEEPITTTTMRPLVYKTLTRNRPSTTTTTTTTTSKPRGIEELEKQLLFQEKNSDTKSGSESVTPATISRSLYERVLNRQTNRIGNHRPVLSSSETSYVNGPGRAQFEGLDDIPEVKSLRRSQKPQYVTIERSKSITKESSSENEDINEDEENNSDVASSEGKSISNPLEDSLSTQRVTPSYVNIRRTRPFTTTSKIENDVEGKEIEIEEEKPTRRRRPIVSSKQHDNEASSETSKPFRNRDSGFRKSEKREDKSTNHQSADKDNDSSTTKTRYSNIQRFRSTTLKTSEGLSSIISEISETTSPTRLEEYPEVSRKTVNTTASLSTTPATTISTSTEVITTISVEPPEPSENSSNVSSRTDIDSTTDSMKLVEDSATEILFTTLPAISSNLSQSTTTTTTTTLASRSTIAAVSQPRPFGFTRRRSSSLETTTTATTPLSRSKVSITPRNSTRPSNPVLGRIRLRTKPVKRVTEEELVDQVDIPHAETFTSRSKDLSRSRGRGSNRYTPPTSRSKTQDVSVNSVPGLKFRERGRTTTSTTVGTVTIDDVKRRYRRPSSRVNNSESIKANELDDSPIVRITQGGSRKNPLYQSQSDEENNKITNIRVFRKPTVNRELYDRTKYTRKRNNVEESLQKVNDDLNQKHIASTLKTFRTSTSAETDRIEGNDLLNGIVIDQSTAKIDSVVESNTIQPIYDLKPIAIDVTTISSNKIDASNQSKDTVATTTTRIETQFNPDLVTIVSTERAFDVAEKTSGTSRKRKIFLRKRPISSSTVVNIIETEEEETSQGPRRRKVIKRKRPLQNTSTSIEVSLEEEKDSSLLLKPTIPMESDKDIEKSTVSINQTEVTLISQNTEESTIVTGLTGFTREMEDSTLTVTETTLSADYNPDGFTKVTLETPAIETTTTSSEEVTDILSTATISTINTDADEVQRSTIEMDTEVTTIESTLATDTTYNTEIARSTFDSRYARKKFIRKNPVSSSGNTTNQYVPALLSTENSSLEILSKRKNHLFIGRPVSPSIVNILYDNLKYKEEKEGEEKENTNRSRDLARQDIVKGTTLRNKSISTNGFSDDTLEFWKHYTTTSLRDQINYSSAYIEDVEDRKIARTEFTENNTYRLTPIVTRGPEIRPRYKVPIILKRPFDPEEALSPRRYPPLDSAPEESEETPETRNARLRQSGFRQPRMRYKLLNRNNVKIEEKTTQPSPESTSTWQYFRTRSYPKRTSTSTEAAITETLIPMKKFDYAADAFHRKHQSLRTTMPRSNDFFDSQNLIDPYYTRTTVKPSVTRLVTSVTESGTTERQKILIKTKYSSLTSTTRIPADQFSPTIPSILVTGVNDDSANEVRYGIERSTLPIEGEFNYRYDDRFTTESYESSTIEIESVADSEAIRLPTLKELIGYPTTYYDDRTAMTSSSILLHLLRNDVDNDISRQNVEKLLRGTDESQDGEKEIAQSPRDIIEETDDSWLQQASENRSRTLRKDDVTNFDERVSVTNTIQEDETKRKTSTNSVYLKPTTMRSISLISLISNPVMRGFYITRSENASSILVDRSTPLYTTTDIPVEQQTETILISDVSMPDEAVTVAYNDQIESGLNLLDDNVNIINDKIVTDHVTTVTNAGAVKNIISTPITANVQEIANDSANMTTVQITNANIGITSSIINYSTDAIPTTISTYDVDSTTLVTAASVTDETFSITKNYSTFTIKNATIPVTTSPLTVIPSTTNTQHIHVTAPMTTNNLADINTNVTTNIMTTPLNVIIPTTTDLNVITSSINTNIPSTSSTSEISPITIRSKNSSVTSPKALIMNTDITSTNSVSTILTPESSTIHLTNSSNFNISNSEILTVTTIAETTEITEIPTFEIPSTFTSTVIVYPKPHSSTNFEALSVVTATLSTQGDENSSTPIITQTPSITTLITNKTIVAVEQSTDSTTPFATTDELIAINSTIQTTTDTYKSDFVRTINEENDSTAPEIKMSEESISKITENQNQTILELNTTNYQFSQKTAKRRVLNRTNNWLGSPTTLQRTNEHQVTLYRRRSQRPTAHISSSKAIEKNRKRRIIQKRIRINSKAFNNTIRSDQDTIDVQNITDHAYDQMKNMRRRKVVLKKRIKEKTNIILPTEETTVFLQTPIIIENETLQTHYENENIKEKQEIILKQSKESLSTIKNISTNSSSINKSFPDNIQNNLYVAKNFSELENPKDKPKSEEKNLIEGERVDFDSINTNLRDNFPKSSYANKNLSDKRITRRRMRVLKNVRSKIEEKNSTIEETNPDFANKNFQNNFLNNRNISQNFPNEEKTRRKMRVVLKRIKSKAEEEETKTEKVSTEDDFTNESLQDSFSNNFRKNFPVKHGTKRRMRVALKSIKPRSEENNSTIKQTSINSDSNFSDKDFQHNFSSNLHENLFNGEDAQRRMEDALKNVKSTSKERDSVAEETNVDSDFARKDSQVFNTFHFLSNLHMGNNLPDKKKMMKYSKSEEEEAMTKQPEDTESQTTRTSVPIEKDTDRFSLEVTNNKSINRNSESGHSNRRRKPTPFTTIAPLTNTLSNTVHRRRRPVETTISSRIDFIDAFEGTESYVKPAIVLHDQNADVSDQSIRAQEFAVTLSDPPSSTSDIGRTPLRDIDRRKISTTVIPRTDPTTSRTVSRYDMNFRSRQRSQTKDRPTVNTTTRPRRPPVIDYDYYEDEVPIVIGKSVLNSKLFLTSKGTIRCMDQGNFPHPHSCKKFISCARMVNGQVIGTEYTCPDKLSFDPVGGICNWSAGLGCKD